MALRIGLLHEEAFFIRINKSTVSKSSVSGFDRNVECFFPPFHKVLSFDTRFNINLLKPTGYVMHQQFNIQQLYVLPTLYLCVLYLSENKQRLVPLTA